MSNFKIAIVKILSSEGGYSNDPDDTGGETYRGISRKFWPKWTGWAVIDSAKKRAGFPANLKSTNILGDAVMNFYRFNFWDTISGDSIKNQSISNMLVDSAVNEGIVPAIKRAQKIVSLPQTGHVTDELLTKLNTLG